MMLQEMEQTIQEVWSLFKETDRKFQETDKKFQETDRKAQERDRRLQEKIQKVSENVDKLTGKWGRFVEGLVAPGITRLFREREIELETVAQRVKTRRGSETMEIDVLGMNSEYAVLVEVKSTLGTDDVNDHIEHLNNFKRFFPEYAGRQVMGAVAGIVIEENAAKFAYRRGLFVIGQSGDTVKILNDTKFRPGIW